MGSPVGAKTSTAYCPPELTHRSSDEMAFRLPEIDHATGEMRKPADAQYELLPASASFDLWAVGAILVRALAHRPLLEADDRDNLRGGREWRALAGWNAESTAALTREVGAVMRDDGVATRDELAALDLLSWLLQADPTARPAARG